MACLDGEVVGYTHNGTIVLTLALLLRNMVPIDFQVR